MPGEKCQYPHVMFCRTCKAVRGEWYTELERSEHLARLKAA
jgi:hypothetical protein